MTPLKLFVTGGAGFLGRHVTTAALERGHEVTVLSRHPDRLRNLPAGIQVMGGDLTAPDDLGKRLARLAPDAVVHAAAIVVDHDPTLHAVNVEGTAALCAMLSGLPQPPRVVHISTFSVEDIPPTDYNLYFLAVGFSTGRLLFVLLRGCSLVCACAPTGARPGKVLRSGR